MADTERLRALLEPMVADLGFDLESLAWNQPQGRKTLSIVLDADGGVSLDSIAEVSREISELLEGTDAAGDEEYALEVSSRGVSAPLEFPRHWRRNIDRLVRVKRRELPEITGRITDADEAGAWIDGERVLYSDITKAVVQIEFKGQ